MGNLLFLASLLGTVGYFLSIVGSIVLANATTLLVYATIFASLLLAFTDLGAKVPASAKVTPSTLPGEVLQSADEYVRRGNERAKKDDLVGVISDCNAALALDSANVAAYFLRGKAYISINRMKAADDFVKVLTLQPDHPQAATLQNFIRDAS